MNWFITFKKVSVYPDFKAKLTEFLDNDEAWIEYSRGMLVLGENLEIWDTPYYAGLSLKTSQRAILEIEPNGSINSCEFRRVQREIDRLFYSRFEAFLLRVLRTDKIKKFLETD